MAIIEWQDSMAIGVYHVDRQHKELVVLINDIGDAVDRGAGRSEVSHFIRRFYDYTMTHFRDEEALMDHEAYPHYFQQVYEHLACAQKAIEFHKRFIEEKDFDLGEMLAYITKWFVDHTTGVDQTLAEYVVTRRAAPGC
uniref:Bacteriohemerythrin n=1 Tax=Fundidesulfovibrio putealis TaxID=270496 RepID=A0A7C4ABU8_9BACT